MMKPRANLSSITYSINGGIGNTISRNNVTVNDQSELFSIRNSINELKNDVASMRNDISNINANLNSLITMNTDVFNNIYDMLNRINDSQNYSLPDKIALKKSSGTDKI